MSIIQEGMEWVRIYYVNGSVRKSTIDAYIKDPPCNGWQCALVLKGEKRSTVFCPYTFQSYSIPNLAGELTGSVDLEFRPDWFSEHIVKKWKEFQRNGWQKDYDTAALIMRKLGLKVPDQIMKDGSQDKRVKGGKEVANTLKKAVKLKSKRGKFLKWFIDGNNIRSIREAMAEFSMSRSNALSYLFMLQKDHGIGYRLVGDNATIEFPEGCSNPFDEPAEDESWLD
jgi:hypothetical protein